MTTSTKESPRELLRQSAAELGRSRKRLRLYEKLGLTRPATTERRLQERLIFCLLTLGGEPESACPSP